MHVLHCKGNKITVDEVDVDTHTGIFARDCNDDSVTKYILTYKEPHCDAC